MVNASTLGPVMVAFIAWYAAFEMHTITSELMGLGSFTPGRERIVVARNRMTRSRSSRESPA
jgi:hypothetical protein